MKKGRIIFKDTEINGKTIVYLIDKRNEVWFINDDGNVFKGELAHLQYCIMHPFGNTAKTYINWSLYRHAIANGTFGCKQCYFTPRAPPNFPDYS